MHVVTRRRLIEFARQGHHDAEKSLDAWYRAVKAASWSNFAEVKESYGSADLGGNFVVFNISGNKYRLIVRFVYEAQTVYIRHVLTHVEYDNGSWKNDDWF